MNYKIIRKLPAMDLIRDELALSTQAQHKIQQDRDEIKAILAGQDTRMLMIVGPCSAWPSEAVLTYAEKLQALNLQVADVMKIVMRVYIQKPRTAKGWTGPITQPDPLREPDIEAGLRAVRELMLKVLALGLPIADEALFIQHAKGFVELLSWVAIGARSTENQEHRIFASGLDCAVGMKNPRHGSLDIAVNSLIAAQHAHVTVMGDHEVQTQGNRYAHLVLRGGNTLPNYSLEHLKEVQALMAEQAIMNPAVIIDASHDNSLHEGKKDPRRQREVILETLDTLESSPDLKPLIKGFMIESFLKEGNQTVDPLQPEKLDLGGLSITDPCLGWEETEAFLNALAERLRS